MNNFGNHLKEIRNKNNLTQKQLAEGVKISERIIQAYELNEKKPSFDTLIKLADFLNCSVDYLLGRTDKPGINK